MAKVFETKPCYETTKYLASLPAATFTQVYEQGRGKGTMTAEEKRSVKQEMAEEMEQLDGYTSDSVQFNGLSLGNLSDVDHVS